MNSESEYITTLAHPDEYSHSKNQVVKLTTSEIIFLKRKTMSKSGWELISYPMNECVSIKYCDKRSIFKTVIGICIIAVIAAAILLICIYWNQLDPGTLVPVGALGIAAIVGFRWFLGSRSHFFQFTMQDGTKIGWKSRSGDFKYKAICAEKIIEFGKSKGIFQSET